MSQTKVLSQSQNNMPIMIDVRENSIVSNSLSNGDEQTPFYSYSTSSHELFNEFGNPSIQGRWTQKEHLIFLA